MVYRREFWKREALAEELLQAGFRYALSLTHHHQDAEDLVQQAWLALARRYGRPSSRALLFQTIRNLFIDSYRRGKLVVFESLEEDVDGVAAEGGQAGEAIQGDLDSLLAHLRSTEREALYLNCVEGYSAAEISRLTRQPRGTVLSLISRAKSKLRKLARADDYRKSDD